ncbi:ATP-dependent helicase C-terminal domain-containing protein [Haliangium sp. UPWRP_2]|uniref:ATP-dependent RNA helicase n=1 Tax=Haliangium sp. UPWRP_2 TaxID=1931276 RepID=UPI000B543452|nr:ATP-dependent helicase C-terminal domain-containing protein [Haliangium sp. UPWRP_2]PSM32463.1 ATP-dependent helicase HrpB [Haliangium sp. UPWRP_2]
MDKSPPQKTQPTNRPPETLPDDRAAGPTRGSGLGAPSARSPSGDAVVPGALPIDSLLPQIRAALSAQAERAALVLEAPPGAGKTTRVPWLLMEELVGAAGPTEVVVLEPRRLAAHLSAARVAEEHGEALGERVGVQMRFASIVGPRTRLRYVTEGVLLRQLQRDPLLSQVRAVVLDELHERHIITDLALSLLRRLQLGPRPDLMLVAMSATLHGERVAEFLGGCPLLRSEGRTFPVEISYQPGEPDEPLWLKVRAALRGLLAGEARQSPSEGLGDVLVFLPGAAEIRRCQSELAELASERSLDILPLHGDLPFEDQRRAVASRRGSGGALQGRRKVILATNVAETSLTIDGVTTVIDSGLSRVAGHSPWSGLPTLRVQPICRAQATQRAGRAGRVAPGRCLRLYSRVDHDNRPEFEVPEIRRSDLAELVLTLLATPDASGASPGLLPESLPFLDAPPPAALESARKLLRRLGALSETGGLSPLGRGLASLPLHPRLARLVLAAAERGLLEDGATLAALLAERDPRLSRSSLPGRGGTGARSGASADTLGPSDLLHLLDLQDEARRRRFDRAALQRIDCGLDADVVQRIERASRQIGQTAEAIVRAAGAASGKPSPARPRLDAAAREQALLVAILQAYPDRVARRRGRPGPLPGGETIELAMAAGGAAVLSENSVVRADELLVVVDVEDRSGGLAARGPTGPGQSIGAGSRVIVRLASAIRADWLLDLPGAPLSETQEVLWNDASERVDVVERMLYEGLILDEQRRPARGESEAEIALLAGRVQAGRYAAFADGESLPHFLAKLAAIKTHAPELGLAPPSDDQLQAVVHTLCRGHRSLSELASLSLCDALLAALEATANPGERRSLRGELARLAPDSLVLPGGRRLRIHYEPDRPPWVASRLQDFFGLREGPRVFAGRVPLVLQLLAPNQRPVQVTTDLAGFWQRHYPALRRELGRRYPRHAWPEDPLQ